MINKVVAAVVAIHVNQWPNLCRVDLTVLDEPSGAASKETRG